MGLSQENIETFYKRTSFTGLCVIYAFTLSKEKDIAFDLNDLVKNVNPGNEKYWNGFSVACAALELVFFNYRNGIVTVKSTGLLTSTKVKEALSLGFDNVAKDFREQYILKIEEYFK